jgi:hypothetical protein
MTIKKIKNRKQLIESFFLDVRLRGFMGTRELPRQKLFNLCSDTAKNNRPETLAVIVHVANIVGIDDRTIITRNERGQTHKKNERGKFTKIVQEHYFHMLALLKYEDILPFVTNLATLTTTIEKEIDLDFADGVKICTPNFQMNVRGRSASFSSNTFAGKPFSRPNSFGDLPAQVENFAAVTRISAIQLAGTVPGGASVVDAGAHAEIPLIEEAVTRRAKAAFAQLAQPAQQAEPGAASHYMPPQAFAPDSVMIKGELINIKTRARIAPQAPQPNTITVGFLQTNHAAFQRVEIGRAELNAYIFVNGQKLFSPLPNFSAANFKMTPAGLMMFQHEGKIFIGRVRADKSDIEWVQLQFSLEAESRVKQFSLCPKGRMLAVLFNNHVLYKIPINDILFEQYGQLARIISRKDITKILPKAANITSMIILPDASCSVLILEDYTVGLFGKTHKKRIHVLANIEGKTLSAGKIEAPKNFNVPDNVSLCAVNEEQFIIEAPGRLGLMSKTPFSKRVIALLQHEVSIGREHGTYNLCPVNNGTQILLAYLKGGFEIFSSAHRLPLLKQRETTQSEMPDDASSETAASISSQGTSIATAAPKQAPPTFTSFN